MIKAGQTITPADFVIVTTAGEALSARDACYIDAADGKAYKCDADDITKIDFVGFAQEAAALNAAVNIVHDGQLGGFTLTRGEDYFLSGTPGEISLTPSGNPVLVGRAVSTSILKIQGGIVKAKVRAWKSDSNTTPGTSYAKATFGTENYDLGGDFASSTFTAPRAGFYDISATLGGNSTSSSTARSMSIAIYKNGTLYSQAHYDKVGASSVPAGVSIRDVLQLVEGDTIEIFARNNGGATEWTYNTGQENSFINIIEL